MAEEQKTFKALTKEGKLNFILNDWVLKQGSHSEVVRISFEAIKFLVQEIHELKEEIKVLKTSQPSKQQNPTDVWKNLKKNNEVLADITNAISVEKNKTEQLEKNLIIFGVANTMTDTQDIVKSIFDKLGKNNINIKNVSRFNTKKGTTSTPIRVELDSVENKIEILKVARRLKNDEDFKEVYIHKDKTLLEREAEKKLIATRKELNGRLTEGNGPLKHGTHNGKKFYWGIRNGEVVRIHIKDTE